MPPDEQRPAFTDRSTSRSAWAPPTWLDHITGWTWRLIVIGVAFWGVLQLFGLLRLVTVPALFALIITALVWPVRLWLCRVGLPELLAAWVVILFAFATMVGIGWLAVAGVGEQLAEDADWEATKSEVERWLVDGPLDLTTEEVDDYEERLRQSWNTGILSVDVGRARAAIELLGAAILTWLLVFFFVKDGPSMWRSAVDVVRPARRATVDHAAHAAFEALSGYGRSVALTGLFDALLIGAVLVVVGVPLALPLALLTFFGAFLPIIGATAVGALSVVVALVTVDARAALIVAVATLVIQRLEGDIVMPLMMRSHASMHPAVVLLSLAAGGAVAGVMGAFVSVPLAAMVMAAMRSIREDERSGVDPALVLPSEGNRS